MKHLSEDRILEITNDISEGMCNASRSDLMQCVRYWSIKQSVTVSDGNNHGGSIAVRAMQLSKEALSPVDLTFDWNSYNKP